MPALKSTSLLHHRGFRAEVAVIRLLSQKEFKLLFQRARTEIAEIDLIFEKDETIFLIEVKTLISPFAAFERVGKKQQQKLRANRVMFARRHPKIKFISLVAFVEADQKISFCRVD